MRSEKARMLLGNTFSGKGRTKSNSYDPFERKEKEEDKRQISQKNDTRV